MDKKEYIELDVADLEKMLYNAYKEGVEDMVKIVVLRLDSTTVDELFDLGDTKFKFDKLIRNNTTR
jgi:hypothetical protein